MYADITPSRPVYGDGDTSMRGIVILFWKTVEHRELFKEHFIFIIQVNAWIAEIVDMWSKKIFCHLNFISIPSLQAN